MLLFVFQQNVEVFKNHFLKLYNNHDCTKYVETILNEIDTQQEDSLLGNKPTEKEILKALAKMLYEKSPGPNVIPTEAFKNLGSVGFLLLCKTILKYWHDAEYNLESITKLGCVSFQRQEICPIQTSGGALR